MRLHERRARRPSLRWGRLGLRVLHLSEQQRVGVQQWPLYDYEGCFSGSSPTRLTLDPAVWQSAWSQSQGKTDPLTVELATITGGVVASVTTSWTFAKGALAGDLYYNTYGSKLVPGQASVSNGAVMRLTPGAAQPTAFLYTSAGASPFGPCVSCHSVSSNGSTLVAQQAMYPGTAPLNGKGSMSFDLHMTPAPGPTTPLANTLNDQWSFSAVYPDGTFLLTAGEPQNTTSNPVFPGVPGNNPGMTGTQASAIYDTATGVKTSPVGLNTPYPMMPMFSPDGMHLVYNGGPTSDAGPGPGHSLTVVDFDLSMKKFSNARTIFQDPVLYPGWPSFTPDSREIIFTLGDNNNFATEVPPANFTLNHAQLYVVDVASGTSHRLDSAEGYGAGGATYLPFPTRDEKLDFYPAINPVATGGYFWVYFTSRRAYGNLYQGSTPPSTTAAYDPNGGVESDVGTKAIWVAAIDTCAAAGTDSSHPAFYLPGQELGSGNIRAVPVLAPCVGNGASCGSGFDCCAGSCVAGTCGVASSCAGTGDRCALASDCCDPTQSCFAGFCSVTQCP